jgi:hypothetical protein
MMDYGGDWLARRQWREGKDFMLQYLYMEWRGAISIAGCQSGTIWAHGRRGIFSSVGYYFSHNWVGGGPPWLVEDLVNEVLCCYDSQDMYRLA